MDSWEMTLDEKMAFYRTNKLAAEKAYQEALASIAHLEEDIKTTVLAMGMTYSGQGIIAKYSKGRKSFDYIKAVDEANIPDERILPFAKIVVDYTALAKAEKIPMGPYTTDGKLSVTLVIEE